MGMFDTIMVEGVKVPGVPDNKLGDDRVEREQRGYGLSSEKVQFQTKDLGSLMEVYVIKPEGLFLRVYEFETRPEIERPYYNTDKWGTRPWPDKPEGFLNKPYSEWGSKRVSGYRDLPKNHHGDVRFYCLESDIYPENFDKKNREYGELMNWIARFTHGQLEYIRVDEEENRRRAELKAKWENV